VRRIAPYVLLAVICVVLFFWRLGAVPLIGFDEGVYAEASREMLVSGDYITPRLNGEFFFDKPPLCYWMQAASMRIFGVNSLATRLPSAVAGLLLVALTVGLGTKLFGRNAGLFAGFALSTSILCAALGRMCLLDMPFALAITAALGAFALAYRERVGRWGYVAFWIAAGLAVMTKGPVGVVLIGAVVGVFAAISRRGRTSGLWNPLGLLLFLAITVPWHVLVEKETGGAFLREFIVHQNIQRAIGKDFHHNQPFWFYAPMFLVGFFPWSVYLPRAWSCFVRRRARNDEDTFALFLAVWAAAVFVVFTLARSKLPSYTFPMYPPAALLVGLLWSRATEKSGRRSLDRCAFWAAALAIPVGTVIAIGEVFLPEPIPGLSAPLRVMGACLAGGAFVSWMLAERKPVWSFAAACAGAVGFLVTAVGMGLPAASEKLTGPSMKTASAIRKSVFRRTPVIAYNLRPKRPAISFYSDRLVTDVATESELLQRTRGLGEFFVISQARRDPGLPEPRVAVARTELLTLYKVGGPTK